MKVVQMSPDQPFQQAVAISRQSSTRSTTSFDQILRQTKTLSPLANGQIDLKGVHASVLFNQDKRTTKTE
jgi:hypothetical protein